MTETLEDEVRRAVIEALRRTDDEWERVASSLKPSLSSESASQRHRIRAAFGDATHPGERWLLESNANTEDILKQVDHDSDPDSHETVAVVSDLRQSSQRLKTAEGKFVTPRDRLYRVHMENSAIIAATGAAMRGVDVILTETLGDGCLALRFLSADEEKDPGPIVRDIYDRAKSLVEIRHAVIDNPLETYQIPAVSFGIGIGYSQAILTSIPDALWVVPKAIGPCVYEATKCAGGKNQVVLSSSAKMVFPRSKSGKIKFKQKTIESELRGYFEPKPEPSAWSRFKLKPRK